MPLSIYQASIPVLLRMLGNLSAILGKAAAHAETSKRDPAELIDARLAEDMFPLARQVQIACDSAKGCGARLAGIENPSFADTETTFDALQARIAKTVAFLQSIDAATFEGAETRTVIVKLPQSEIQFTGLGYLFDFALPNFFFHVTTAYAILRANGVVLGKTDFLGA